jgi:hypothetical protein
MHHDLDSLPIPVWQLRYLERYREVARLMRRLCDLQPLRLHRPLHLLLGAKQADVRNLSGPQPSGRSQRAHFDILIRPTQAEQKQLAILGRES